MKASLTQLLRRVGLPLKPDPGISGYTQAPATRAVLSRVNTDRLKPTFPLVVRSLNAPPEAMRLQKYNALYVKRRPV